MSLKLMYITNNPEVAQIAEASGVDRIFVDMEYIGKSDRQGGMDTVQSRHTVEDVKLIRKCLKRAQLLVRVNPIHEATENYDASAEEIDAVITGGADILMLPYFKTVEEVKAFIALVNGRAQTMLLVETPEAVEKIDEILSLEGIDEVFVGLNDLSLGYGKKFMFELLADGTVERLCMKFRLKGLPYGFGGIAALGKGMLPAEHIIGEHYRLGSTCAILSRSFCDLRKIRFKEDLKDLFSREMICVREHETFCMEQDESFFAENAEKVRVVVANIVK